MIDMIKSMMNNAKILLNDALKDTEYANYVDEILDHYKEFLKTGLDTGLIKTEDYLSLYVIKDIKYYNGTQYANWVNHSLTLQKRYFVERNNEERRNVLFHELIHSLMEKLFSYDNEKYTDFTNYVKNIDSLLTEEQITNIKNKYKDIFTDKYFENNSNIVCESFKTFNEVTTQYLAEVLTAHSYKKEIKEPDYFSSKIFNRDDYFISDFSTYPEYEQIFINFLRTLNGFGKIQDNNELLQKWFTMLSTGDIWNHIIGSYKEQDNTELLFEFLIGFAALRKAKENSMGIGVEYEGDKELLTNSLIELDKKLKKNINLQDEKKYDYEEYPPINEHTGVLRFNKKR